MPTPGPTTRQVELVREAAKLTSLSHTATLISALTDTQWAEMLLTLEVWETARHDDVKIGGRVQIDPEKTRALLTDEIRGRLGLPPIDQATMGLWVTESTPTKAVL